MHNPNNRWPMNEAVVPNITLGPILGRGADLCES
jgi:hypothetical protein